jgi:repressor LexA
MKMQDKVVIYIKNYTKEHGYPPSLVDIKDDLGFGSVSAVFKYVKDLEEEGLVKREPRKARTLIVL